MPTLDHLLYDGKFQSIAIYKLAFLVTHSGTSHFPRHSKAVYDSMFPGQVSLCEKIRINSRNAY